MKKVYPLKKEILFKNNIYDILSIAIDKKFSLDGYAIKGQFKINGEYLIRENEHDEFDIDLPYLNYIDDSYDISKIKVDIDDFYYEIKDSNKLVISIEIAVDGLVEKEEERCIDNTDELEDELKEENDSSIAEIRDIDIIQVSEEIEANSHEEELDNTNVEEITEVYEEYNREAVSDKIIESLPETERDNMKNEYFEAKENKEFITYKVCIVRDGDTMESIVEKYGSNVELIKKYNVINELKVGDKIIIPYERS